MQMTGPSRSIYAGTIYSWIRHFLRECRPDLTIEPYPHVDLRSEPWVERVERVVVPWIGTECDQVCIALMRQS